MDKSYNGWKNYETWNLALWAGNDEPVYRAVQERKRQIKRFSAGSAEDLGRELFPNGTPDMDGMRDMRKVCWGEIATSWNE